jgi:signal transduction histidine kinase
MLRSLHRTPERTAELYGGVAFCAVVVAAFAQLWFYRDRFSLPTGALPALIAGGALYLTAAILSGRWTDHGNKLHRALYFGFQTLLVSAMIIAVPTPGFFGIIALPLAAQAIVDLRISLALPLNLFLYAVCVATYWRVGGSRVGINVAVSFLPAFLFTAVFAYLTARALRLRAEAETLSRELGAANDQLRKQSAQAEELATVRERNRLAREIHDGLGHYLTVIHVQVEAARALLEKEPSRAADSLAKAARLSREALDEVRRSVGDLHHHALTVPLVTRLEQLCADAGGPVRCCIIGTPRSLPSGIEHALYRAAQEGLTNVRKHAGRAETEMTVDFRQPKRVSLAIQDNGMSPTAASPDGFGLRGMRERIALLGGDLSAGPREAGGFSLRVELPT